MQERTLPKLLVSREEAEEKIQARIEEGQKLRDWPIDSEQELDIVGKEAINWSSYNYDLLITLFANFSSTNEYDSFYYPRMTDEYRWDYADALGHYHTLELDWKINEYKDDIEDSIKSLERIRDKLELFEEQPELPSRNIMENGKHIFIGHGHSPIWRELKDFINERFDRVSTPGLQTIERLKEMLDQACMAFLIMTAEDEQSDGKMRARENVVHEAGLFQGRLGFKKAIILLEEDCEEFSNIKGLGQIRFPKGNIKAAFEEIRQVLEREEVI